MQKIGQNVIYVSMLSTVYAASIFTKFADAERY